MTGPYYKELRNRMNRMFGLKTKADVEFMTSKFSLIGITERYEESLVLASHLLCMPLWRMSSIKMKESSRTVRLNSFEKYFATGR